LQHIWFPSNYVWSYYYYYYQMSLKRPDVWSLNLDSDWQKISRYFGPQLAGANWTPLPPLYSWVLLKKPFSMRSATICRFCPPSLCFSFYLGPDPSSFFSMAVWNFCIRAVDKRPHPTSLTRPPSPQLSVSSSWVWTLPHVCVWIVALGKYHKLVPSK